MQYRIHTDPRKLIGKRPNLAEEKSVTDEIVSAFTVPPERAPLPPLSPLPATAPRPPRKRNPQGSTIAAAILLILPFVYPAAFFVHGAVSRQPLPVLMYPLLVLMAQLLSNIGSLVLYLAARAAHFLRKTIGWTSLAMLALQLASVLLFGKLLYIFDPNTAISKTRGMFALVSVVLTFLCMLALCVFSVLMLVRVFRKKEQTPVT